MQFIVLPLEVNTLLSVFWWDLPFFQLTVIVNWPSEACKVCIFLNILCVWNNPHFLRTVRFSAYFKVFPTCTPFKLLSCWILFLRLWNNLLNKNLQLNVLIALLPGDLFIPKWAVLAENKLQYDLTVNLRDLPSNWSMPRLTRRDAETYILVGFFETLVILAEGSQKHDWCHVLKAVDPFFSLAPLPSNIYNPAKRDIWWIFQFPI